MQDIAKSGNVGKSKCYELFKRYVNKTPNDFVNLYRLEKSKILLKNEDLSITEVALECGFNSGSYYAELFKNIMDVLQEIFVNIKNNLFI